MTKTESSFYKKLIAHIGHEIECVYYGLEHEYIGDAENVSVECITCGEVIVSANKYMEE